VATIVIGFMVMRDILEVSGWGGGTKIICAECVWQRWTCKQCNHDDDNIKFCRIENNGTALNSFHN